MLVLHPPVDPPAVITSGYQLARPNPLEADRAPLPHLALDFRAPKGARVLAAADGVVVRAYVSKREDVPLDSDGKPTRKPRWYGYGLRVVVAHGGGYRTTYSHLLALAMVPSGRGLRPLQPGDKVARGEVIAYADSTGDTRGPHLHFELISPDDKMIDPSPFMVCPVPMSLPAGTAPPLALVPDDGVICLGPGDGRGRT